MCNEVARRIELGLIRQDFAELRIPLRFSEGVPNMAPLPSVRITDRTVIIRAARDAAHQEADESAGTAQVAELVTRRWSWPGTSGKPVYNYRSEGRDFRNSARQGRCLVPVDGFYEFTAPADPRSRRKDKWLFRWKARNWFAIAGLWKSDPAIPDPAGEAFTLLTCDPGPDVAAYHNRQVVLLDRADWAGWLDGSVPAQQLLRPTPGGTLSVEPAGEPRLL